ncbi:MAG: T9SS type A sorting domain-containing protein [Candidatus Marinimicrobia bacterium]|nr:T9SS type A sorting domain-containing protein [Candidatus Neomarinimicrobiota bacterium]
MRQFKKHIIPLGVFVLIGFLTADNSESVNLSLYEGTDSILLDWEIPGGTVSLQTVIFRKTDFQSPFQKLTEVDGGVSRYCDSDLQTDTRYFYKIQIQYENGEFVDSPNDIPPFAHLLQPAESPEWLASYKRDMIQWEFNDFTKSVIQDVFNILFPQIHPAGLEKLSRLLLSDSQSIHPWISLFLLEDYTKYETITKKKARENILQQVSERWDDAEPVIRNRVGSTPKEWKENCEGLNHAILNQLNKLTDIYSTDINYYKQLSPLWITQQIPDKYGIDISILILNRQNVDSENSFLSCGNEHLNIPIESSLKNGSVVHVQIPANWEYANLISHEMVLQSIPMTHERGYSVSLDGEYTPIEENVSMETRLFSKEKNIWMNEWIISPSENIWSVEIAGLADTANYYGIYLEDDLIWEFESIPSTEIMFYDSTFLLQKTLDEVKWVHLKKQTPDESWTTIESRMLDPNVVTMQGREPDGGKWINTQENTLGKTNIYRKKQFVSIPIPEIFALYQNYPNPFNGSTTIFFDMIQPARVNLYISDARGRVVETFVEDETLQNGHYSFLWEDFHLSSGVYFITMVAQIEEFPPIVFSRKMIYLK